MKVNQACKKFTEARIWYCCEVSMTCPYETGITERYSLVNRFPSLSERPLNNNYKARFLEIPNVNSPYLTPAPPTSLSSRQRGTWMSAYITWAQWTADKKHDSPCATSGKHYKDIWQWGPKPEFSACKLKSSIFQIHSYQDIPLQHGVFPVPICPTESTANTPTHCSSLQIMTRGGVCTWADYKDTQKILGYAGFWLTISHWEQVLLTCS